MLRVIVFDERFTLKVRLEGVLDAESAQLYRQAMNTAIEKRGARKLSIDAGDLKLATGVSHEILLDAFRSGARFVAANDQVSDLLRAEETLECKRKCGIVERFTFAVAQHCERSRRAFCFRMHAFLKGKDRR